LNTHPIAFLQSERTCLRPVETADVPLIARWLNNPAITKFMFYGQLPMNLEQATDMVMGQVRSSHNTVFMVCDRRTKRPIGFAGLYDIHLTAHKADFRILLGERRSWGKGIGTEVTELLTFYGFDRLNLHRLALGLTAENKGARRTYEKAGYVLEGTLRDDIYRNGRYYDSLKMAILREDYLATRYVKHQKRFG